MQINALILIAASLLQAKAQSSVVAPVNTATITDATGAIQTPTESIARVSPTAVVNAISSNGVNPLQATDAVTAINPAASTVATDTLSTDLIKPTMVAAVVAQDLFAPIANDDPVAVLGGSITNLVQPVALDGSYGGQNGIPIQTNKFYGNLLNGDRTQTVFLMPYSLFWSKNRHGLCVSNAANTDYAYGPSNDRPTYYYSPIFRCPIGFSSTEMDASQTMSLGNLNQASVDLTFTPGSGVGSMKSTLVQGSAFISMTYANLQPILFSGTAAFTSLAPVTFKAPVNENAVSKFRITTNNGDTWLVYVFQSAGPAFSLVIDSNQQGTQLLGSAGFSGTIQIAKLPAGASTTDEAFYDSGAGTFATNMVLGGSVNGASASYTFDYRPQSLIGNPLLTFLFPHQQQSVTSGAWSDLRLWSTTKGLMRGRYGNTLTFSEANLPIDIQFLPWSPLGNLQNYSAPALQVIAAAANKELKQSISDQSNLADMYFSGKVLAKFAQICLAVNDVLGADATDCISRLESATERFTNGNNQSPLRYDTTWKGAIASCGLGLSVQDWQSCAFGNAVYNDHHFHASYLVYTAAVLAHLDPSWLTRGKNKAYINTLVRDFANPSAADTAFPVFRSFDWVAGHSWAHGLLASGDGKDEESSSEDYNSYYAMKLWGKVIGDSSMEARGNLMLSILRRSMQSYMLMAQDNTVQPPQFLHNFVSGITFENKVDHTTYFGNNIEYIHGIHMLPLTPMSAFVRTPTFVAQEWDAVIKPVTTSIQGTGWAGIVWANLAISNSTASFNYFADPAFDNRNLDDGASLTWYLTYAAGLGGAGNFQLAVNASDGVVKTTVAPQVQVTSAPAQSSTVPATTTASTTAASTTAASTTAALTTARVSSLATVSGSPVILPETQTTSASATASLALSVVLSSTLSVVSSLSPSTSASSSAGAISSSSAASVSSMVTASAAVPVISEVTIRPSSSTMALPNTQVSKAPIVASIAPIAVTTLVSSLTSTVVVVQTPTVSVSVPAIAASTIAASSIAPVIVSSVKTTIVTVAAPRATTALSPIAKTSSSVAILTSQAPAGVAPVRTNTAVVVAPVSTRAAFATRPASPPAAGNTIVNPVATLRAASSIIAASPPTTRPASATATVKTPDNVVVPAGPAATTRVSGTVVIVSQAPVANAPGNVATPATSAAAAAASPSASSTSTFSGTCGGASFQAGTYVCWDNKQLCPIVSGVAFQNCNGACYDPKLYSCANGGLVQGSAIATPAAGKLATCGAQNYNSAAYTCFGAQLCPIQAGVATQLCGRDCYNPAIYSCANGRLAPVRR